MIDLDDFVSTKSFAEMKLAVIDAGEPEYAFTAAPDFFEHVNNIRREYSGRSELEFYQAILIVAIRRQIDTLINVEKFTRVWLENYSFLTNCLDSRWLVSACDTIVDYWPDEAQRALALAGSLFANTIKAYETERVVTGQRSDLIPYAKVDNRIPLYDGMVAFSLGKGDMIFNLHRRTNAVTTSMAGPGSAILAELQRRANIFDTVFARFSRVHTREETRW